MVPAEHPAPLPARTHPGVADTSQHIDPHRFGVLPETNRTDSDTMSHEPDSDTVASWTAVRALTGVWLYLLSPDAERLDADEVQAIIGAARDVYKAIVQAETPQLSLLRVARVPY